MRIEWRAHLSAAGTRPPPSLQDLRAGSLRPPAPAGAWSSERELQADRAGKIEPPMDGQWSLDGDG